MPRRRNRSKKRSTSTANKRRNVSWAGEMGGAVGGGRVGVLSGATGRPLADFSFTVLGPGQQVEFNGALSRPSPISQSPIVSYEWVFFDGTGAQATGPNPSYTFAPPPQGTGPTAYTVTLRVTDANGEQAIRTQSVPIPDPPVVPPLINQLPTPPVVDAQAVATDVVLDITNAIDLVNEGSVVNFAITGVLQEDNPTFDGQSPTLPLTLAAPTTLNAPPPLQPGTEQTQYVVLDTVLPNGNNQTKVVAVETNGTITEVTRSPVPVAAPSQVGVKGSQLVYDPVTKRERYSSWRASFTATGSQDGQGNLLSTTSDTVDPSDYGMPTQNASQTNLVYTWTTSDPALVIDGPNNMPTMQAVTSTPGTYQVTLRVLNPITQDEATDTIDVTIGVQLPVPPDVSFLPLGGNSFWVSATHGTSNQTGLKGTTRVVVWDGINSTEDDPLFDGIVSDQLHGGRFDIENDGVHNVRITTMHV